MREALFNIWTVLSVLLHIMKTQTFQLSYNQTKWTKYPTLSMETRFKDKKEEIWPSPMTKAPAPTEMSKGQSDSTNNATKKVLLNSDCGPT